MNFNVIADKNYFSKTTLDSALDGHGIVVGEFDWCTLHYIWVVTMGGNPKTAERRLKDLLWKAGYRNLTEYGIQPEWPVFYQPEGYISYLPTAR